MGSQTDLSAFELGWLVGILEGEGTFQYTSKQTHRVAVQMADEDTIYKVSSLFSRILGAYINVVVVAPAKDHHSDMYYVAVSGANARKIMRLVVKHMSDRRRIKIWQALNKYMAVPKISPDLCLLDLVKESI